LLELFGYALNRVNLKNVSSATVSPRSIVFSTVELSKPVFQNLTSDELECVQLLTDNATIIIWITGGGLFKSERPELNIVHGVARTVMLEQPTTKFFVLDVDDFTGSLNTTMAHVLWVLDEARQNPKPQFEYLSYEGVLYTSRFEGVKPLNQLFQSRQNLETVKMPLQEAGHCNLAIETPGLTDTLYFSQHDSKDTLMTNFVEVNTKCVGLNAKVSMMRILRIVQLTVSKDILVLGGKVDTKNATCALEFAGVISRVGPDVTGLVAGDRVVVMAPSRFSTYEIVPDWACCKLIDEEDFATLSSIPMVFATAIHALQGLARLKTGESILIHSAAGGVGIAAIQIAQLIGAEVFVTVGTEAKKQFLIDQFAIQQDHIFDSHGSAFLPALLAASSGRGVDVILNSLTRDQLHDSFFAIAEFGRFIEIGKKDIVEGGKLDMGVFKRNATFTAFDLTGLYHSDRESHHQIWSDLLHQGIRMLREKKIRPVHPFKVFDVSEISQAYRHLSQRNRMGKIAVSLENLDSSVAVLPKKYSTRLDPLKSYLMIGALGGIGRSLSMWMFSRGARKFTFLNRSGVANTRSAQLVKDLQALGAEVDVMQGDVSVSSDVEKAVNNLSYPLGGIILSAMGLQVSRP
jgi:NADPH:quinone reductase-like Zn-dependent oxidoreductase